MTSKKYDNGKIIYEKQNTANPVKYQITTNIKGHTDKWLICSCGHRLSMNRKKKSVQECPKCGKMMDAEKAELVNGKLEPSVKAIRVITKPDIIAIDVIYSIPKTNYHQGNRIYYTYAVGKVSINTKSGQTYLHPYIKSKGYSPGKTSIVHDLDHRWNRRFIQTISCVGMTNGGNMPEILADINADQGAMDAVRDEMKNRTGKDYTGFMLQDIMAKNYLGDIYDAVKAYEPAPSYKITQNVLYGIRRNVVLGNKDLADYLMSSLPDKKSLRKLIYENIYLRRTALSLIRYCKVRNIDLLCQTLKDRQAVMAVELWTGETLLNSTYARFKYERESMLRDIVEAIPDEKERLKFLRTAAPAEENARRNLNHFQILVDTVDMHLACGRNLEFIRNSKNLGQLHDTLTEEYELVREKLLEERMTTPYALSETILGYEEQVGGYSFEAVKTAKQLRDVGKKMHNCVFSYDDDVRRGDSVIFTGSKDGKLASCIELIPFGRWTMDPNRYRCIQALGPCNQEMSDEAAVAFRKWTTSNNIRI